MDVGVIQRIGDESGCTTRCHETTEDRIPKCEWLNMSKKEEKKKPLEIEAEEEALD
jgi:hypothetical protein